MKEIPTRPMINVCCDSSDSFISSECDGLAGVDKTFFCVQLLINISLEIQFTINQRLSGTAGILMSASPPIICTLVSPNAASSRDVAFPST